MTEIYTQGPLGDITSTPLASKWYDHKDVISREREKSTCRITRSNKVWWIPMIGSRTSNISRDKGKSLRRWKVHTITRVIVEYIGVITDLQIPLLIIDRRGVSIMSILFANRRVTHLRFDDAFERIRNIEEYFGQHRNCFGENWNSSRGFSSNGC